MDELSHKRKGGLQISLIFDMGTFEQISIFFLTSLILLKGKK